MADSNCACVRELQDGGCQSLRHCARLNTLLIQMISRWHILNNKVDLTNFFSKKNHVMGTTTLKLEELFQHSLFELKCNVHPLDGISNVYDNDNGIQSYTFDSDCAVANVIYELTKMRFKQGTGDTSAILKHFLRCENIKLRLLLDK